MKYIVLVVCFFYSCKSKEQQTSDRHVLVENKDFSGVYQKDHDVDDSIYMSLIRINDTCYFFEIRDGNVNKSFLRKRFQFGILSKNDLTLKVLSSTAGQYGFLANITQKGINIDSTNFDWYSDFKDIVGGYSKIQGLRAIVGYPLVKTEKWDEGRFAQSSTIYLYKYPHFSADSVLTRANKNDVVTNLWRVRDRGDGRSDWFYVEFKDGNNKASGWIRVSNYYNLAFREFQCERHDDGIVEKWNKEAGFTRYYDSTGKLLKTEFER